jgi:DNA-binding XRE family transcriptional regulator
MNPVYQRRLDSGSQQIIYERIKLGRKLAGVMVQVRTQETVARTLGISRQSVDSCEAQALAKIYARMKELI